MKSENSNYDTEEEDDTVYTKEDANMMVSQGKYREAIKIYSNMILDCTDDMERSILLSNSSVAKNKMGNYEGSIKDSKEAIKLRPDWGKAWGRLGASLYCSATSSNNNETILSKAITAYRKALELDTNITNKDIYIDMIYTIKLEQNKFNPIPNMFPNDMFPNDMFPNDMFQPNIKMKGMNMENMFNSMLDTVMNDKDIFDKLKDPTFQNKINSMQNNPLEALQDDDVMNVMKNLMKGMHL